MHYVILRDDDTNAFTPAECLERLYRPFLDRGWPVNLATIPEVSSSARTAEGKLEAFLTARAQREQEVFGRSTNSAHNSRVSTAVTLPPPPAAATTVSRPAVHAIGSNADLTAYLQENRCYHIVQHGLHHTCQEFASGSSAEIAAKLERGTQLLEEAGFAPPAAFVAPQDKFSPIALKQAARRFKVISTGWFELNRLPKGWWPRYLLKKVRQRPHWQIGQTLLLSHPGCLLSCYRDYSTMADNVLQHVRMNRLSVVVTHWWEYFRDGRPDDEFIRVLHEVARRLANATDVRVISFRELSSNTALN